MLQLHAANYVMWRLVRLLSPGTTNQMTLLTVNFSKALYGSPQTEPRYNVCNDLFVKRRFMIFQLIKMADRTIAQMRLTTCWVLLLAQNT